ncbi:hypothetical protein ABEF95_002725 [Exophiala dermatitidis]
MSVRTVPTVHDGRQSRLASRRRAQPTRFLTACLLIMVLIMPCHCVGHDGSFLKDSDASGSLAGSYSSDYPIFSPNFAASSSSAIQSTDTMNTQNSASLATSPTIPTMALTITGSAAMSSLLGSLTSQPLSGGPPSFASYSSFAGEAGTQTGGPPAAWSSNAPNISQTVSSTVTVHSTKTFYTTSSTEATVLLPSSAQLSQQPGGNTTPGLTITVLPIGPISSGLSTGNGTTINPGSADSDATTAVPPTVSVTSRYLSTSTTTVYITPTVPPSRTTTTVTVMETPLTSCSGDACSAQSTSISGLASSVTSNSTSALSDLASSNLLSQPSTTTDDAYSTFWQSYSSYMAAHPNPSGTGQPGPETNTSSTLTFAGSDSGQSSLSMNGSTGSTSLSPSVPLTSATALASNAPPKPSSLPPGIFFFPDTDGIGYSWSRMTLSGGHLTATRLGPMTTTCVPTTTVTTVGEDGVTKIVPQCKAGPGPMVTPGVTTVPTTEFVKSTAAPANSSSSSSSSVSSATTASALLKNAKDPMHESTTDEVSVTLTAEASATPWVPLVNGPDGARTSRRRNRSSKGKVRSRFWPFW